MAVELTYQLRPNVDRLHGCPITPGNRQYTSIFDIVLYKSKTIIIGTRLLFIHLFTVSS